MLFRSHRLQNSVPILIDLRDCLIRLRVSTADGSGLARAIDYTLKRWESLIRYAQTGNLPIDNNPVENAIRPIAIGKKNWLFAGSERAGKRAAAIQSLFATAKLNGIEPAAWLKDTLEKLPVWTIRIMPTLRTAYQLKKYLSFDFEAGLEKSTTDTTSQTTEGKRQFYSLGFRWDF